MENKDNIRVVMFYQTDSSAFFCIMVVLESHFYCLLLSLDSNPYKTGSRIWGRRLDLLEVDAFSFDGGLYPVT